MREMFEKGSISEGQLLGWVQKMYRWKGERFEKRKPILNILRLAPFVN